MQRQYITFMLKFNVKIRACNSSNIQIPLFRNPELSCFRAVGLRQRRPREQEVLELDIWHRVTRVCLGRRLRAM